VEKEKEYALNWIESNRDRIILLSDTVWEYAELGLKEFKSSKLLADELEKHGFKVEMGIVHGVSGLAAAIAVRYAMERFGIKGTIRFYGCPAEENFSGKVFMVRDGYFNNVDAVISHHPSTMNGAIFMMLESTILLREVEANQTLFLTMLEAGI